MLRRLTEIWPPFHDAFRLATRTTTHFLTPFLAALSFEHAHRMSRLVPHSWWRLPVGNLVLAMFTKT
jgi:hypothetical protein